MTHLDGHVVQLERKEVVTQPGFVQTIKGEGMPLFGHPTSHGDLFVEYNVVLPTHLSKETRRGASKLGSPWVSPDVHFASSRFTQILLRHFMESRIEITANYRLICDYCIPFPPCILGILAFQCITYEHESGAPGPLKMVIGIVFARQLPLCAQQSCIAYQPHPAAQ